MFPSVIFMPAKIVRVLDIILIMMVCSDKRCFCYFAM